MLKQEGKIVDILGRRIYSGIITYNEEKIISIEERSDISSSKYIIPGFIDSHIHIESTMLSPSEFARNVVKNGTVAVMADPHEIANVCGEEGVDYMLNDAEKTPFKFYFGIPSCVPATPFEICGGELSSNTIDKMFASGKFSFLGEFMNVPGVVNEDLEVLAKLKIAKKYNLPIDGHAPALSGEDLNKYISYGITTDHEFFSFDNSVEKIEKGMNIQIREGSASKDFDDLFPLIDMYPDKIMFCTDDSHPEDLLKLGHIDKIVKMAISKGLDVFNILRAACINPILHYGLDLGMIREGDKSNFVLVDDLENFNIVKTVIDGKTVFENGVSNILNTCNSLINNFSARSIFERDIKLASCGRKIKVIDIADGTLVSNKLIIEPKLNNGDIVSDIDHDVLKIVLHNRYKKLPLQVAFIKGFKLKRGAIASSISHDSHNILAVGTSNSDIVNAVNKIVESKGGIVAIDGDSYELLELPIAGLMSDKDIYTVRDSYSRLLDMSKSFGCTLDSPFMTLAFMSLIVIPELKLGSRGLFEFSNFEFVDLFE